MQSRSERRPQETHGPKEQTDPLHWQKLQPPRTFSRLQGKSEHEVPPTDKNLAQHHYAQSTVSQLEERSLGKEHLPSAALVQGWVFCLLF